MTLAADGEMGSGEPTIVGLWVHYSHRREGVGRALLEAAVRRMVERGLTTIRLDLLSSKIEGMIEQLPEDLKKVLDVRRSFSCDLLLDM